MEKLFEDNYLLTKQGKDISLAFAKLLEGFFQEKGLDQYNLLEVKELLVSDINVSVVRLMLEKRCSDIYTVEEDKKG